jgi:hypothetical protein
MAGTKTISTSYAQRIDDQQAEKRQRSPVSSFETDAARADDDDDDDDDTIKRRRPLLPLASHHAGPVPLRP